jgi:hypothetical protein
VPADEPYKSKEYAARVNPPVHSSILLLYHLWSLHLYLSLHFSKLTVVQCGRQGLLGTSKAIPRCALAYDGLRLSDGNDHPSTSEFYKPRRSTHRRDCATISTSSTYHAFQLSDSNPQSNTATSTERQQLFWEGLSDAGHLDKS